jgi:hypothetical protein
MESQAAVLFSHISVNWRGRPPTSHEVIVDLIGATTTRQGLRVHAERDVGTPASWVATPSLPRRGTRLTDGT